MRLNLLDSVWWKVVCFAFIAFSGNCSEVNKSATASISDYHTQMETLIDSLHHLLIVPQDEHRKGRVSAIVTDDIEFYGIRFSAMGLDEFMESFVSDGGRLARATEVTQQRNWLICGRTYIDNDGNNLTDEEGVPYRGYQFCKLEEDGRFSHIIIIRQDLIPTFE